MYRLKSERGAVLMHVILATIMLIGINVFVVDYGVMWVGRNQAQNAADAGAMAGAIALAYDNYADRTETGAAKVFAWQTVQENWVWSKAPKIDIKTDVTFPTNVMNLEKDPVSGAPVWVDMCAGTPTPCVRVDVYRDAVSGNRLPSLFGGAVGVTGSDVKAMAIAKWGAANASVCMKPWAIPDKWLDHYDDPANSATVDVDTWTDDDFFDLKYPKKSKLGNPGDPIPATARDVYEAPSDTGTGTGFTLAKDLGRVVTLKEGDPNDTIAPGNYFPVDLPLKGGGISNGAKDYYDNIVGCNGAPVKIGDQLSSKNGNMPEKTNDGVDYLISQDKDAYWDSKTNTVKNSCAQAATPCAAISPRIVPIAIYDTGSFQQADRQTGNVKVTVVNILGFFIDRAGVKHGDVIGYLTTVPGLLATTAPAVGTDSGFAKVIMLVR